MSNMIILSAEDPNIHNYITVEGGTMVPKIFQKNGLDKYFIKPNECIFEFTEYKNLYLLYPARIIHVEKLSNYIDELKQMFLEMLLKTYSEKFLKLLDIKIVLYLPVSITLSQFYKAGPLSTTVYGVELAREYNWYEYVLKMNQFIYTTKNNTSGGFVRTKQKSSKKSTDMNTGNSMSMN